MTVRKKGPQGINDEINAGLRREGIEPVNFSAERGGTSGFIIEFFTSRIDAPICVTALPNERGNGKPVTIYTRDVDEIAAFVEANDRPGWAVYFSVNPVIEGQKRNKENTAAIVVLHADLDYKGIVQDHAAILEALKQLSVPPSLIVSSGHGLHCYWLLSTVMPTTETDRVEDCLKQIARVLAGDPAVCEIARIMRLPGSHNSKNDGEWLDVHVVGERGPDYEFSDLEEYFSTADPVLTRVAPIEKEQKATQGNGHDSDAPDYDPWEKYGINIKDALDPEVELELMQYHDSSGHGIDRTQLRVIGHYISQGQDLDQVISYVVAKTFEVIPESVKCHAGNRAAAEREEVSKLRDMCARTYRKFPQHIEKQDSWPEWAINDGRLKKLLNGHRAAPVMEPPANTVEPPANTAANVVQFPAPKKPEKKLPEIESLFLEDLQERPEVALEWIATGFILARALNGLFGDGGVGKDMILFQLAIAMTCDTLWLGLKVMQGKVIYIATEDDLDELRRRETRITKYYKETGSYTHRNKQLKIMPMIGKDTVLAVYDHKAGVVVPTPLYTSLCKTIEDFKPTLVIVGNRVNIFSINQNEDAHARQCLTLLNNICVTYNCAVIMPSHVSVRGADEGTSGSVQWSNGIRLRSFLSRIEKDEDNKNQPFDPEIDLKRELTVKKSNWSARGEVLAIEWRDGFFHQDGVHEVKVDAPEGEVIDLDAQRKARDKAREAEVDQEFLNMLAKETLKKNKVSPKLNAPNFAPKVFSDARDCRCRGIKGKNELKAAMDRLYGKGIIQSVEYKASGHPHAFIELVPE